VSETQTTTPENATLKKTAAPRTKLTRSVFFIALVAFLLRVAVITIGHTYKITPRRDHFQFGWEMGRLARSIALGQGFSNPTDLQTGLSAWAPPLYPYVLGGVFKVFGIYTAASAWVILTFNSIFAAFTCLTLYRLAQRIFDERIARAAAWTWALFPYFLYWPTRVVWETSLTTFLLSLALLMTLQLQERDASGQFPARKWCAYGVLWGVILLTNTAVVSLLPFFLLWLLWQSKTRARVLTGGALCMVLAAAAVGPWLIRNYEVFGTFVFVRDNLPLELHMANNEHSEGLWTRNEHPGNDAAAMRQFQETGELRFMGQKKIEFDRFLREHSDDFAWFSLQRAAYFWIAPPSFTNFKGYDLGISRHMNFFLGAAFAFSGLWLALRNRVRGGFLLACCMLVYPLPYYMVNPFPRYKHPIEPVMALLVVYLMIEAGKVQIHWRAKRQ
jgi:4-amino-4-deoxy-L-arabinose transferase-like glycosyltransferase